MNVLLAAVWVLVVMPTPTEKVPHPKEFRVENVEFANIADCDAAGRKWVGAMTDHAARGAKGPLVWGRQTIAAEGATVTFSCVERAE